MSINTVKYYYEMLKLDADEAWHNYKYSLSTQAYKMFIERELRCAEFAAEHEEEIWGVRDSDDSIPHIEDQTRWKI